MRILVYSNYIHTSRPPHVLCEYSIFRSRLAALQDINRIVDGDGELEQIAHTSEDLIDLYLISQETRSK